MTMLIERGILYENIFLDLKIHLFLVIVKAIRTLFWASNSIVDISAPWVSWPCYSYQRHSILHMAMYMFPSCCLHLSHPLLPPLIPQVCCLCVHLLCKQAYQYHLSRFHIYVSICHICFSLSDLLHSVNRLQVNPPHQNQLKCIPFYG